MTIPVAPDIFRHVDGEVRLIAGRSRDTGALAFPLPQGGEADRHEAILLPATGTLWSWTVQRFRPKPPFDGTPEQDFIPYGVAYVQLGDMLIVEGRVVSDRPQELSIGQAMRVTTETYTFLDSGEPVETYAFTPMENQP